MVAAHVGSACIQADHRRAEAWVSGLAPDWPIDPVWPVLVVLAWAAWWLALGPRPLATLDEAFGRVRGAWGAGPAAVVLGALLLPHRVFDDNSGFLHLDGDSPLLVIGVILDVIRGLGAFAVFHALFLAHPLASPEATDLTAPMPAPSSIAGGSSGKPDRQAPSRHSERLSEGGVAGSTGLTAASPEPDRGFPAQRKGEPLRAEGQPPARRWSWAVTGTAVAVAGLAAALQFGPLQNIPHVDDEIIQDWHARLLAHGKLQAASFPGLESFSPDHKLNDNGRHLFSTYQPGLAVLWAIAHRWGAKGLVNPLLAALAILLWFDLVAATHGGSTGRRAALLLGWSPFLIVMAAGRMNHLLALLLIIVGARGLVAGIAGRRWSGALMAGLAVGGCLLTRRVDALALLGGVAGTAISFPGFDRRRVLFLAVFLLVVGGSLAGQAALSQLHTGDPAQATHQIGAAVSSWGRTPLAVYWQNLLDNALGFTVFAFGGVVAGFLGFAFLRWRPTPPVAPGGFTPGTPPGNQEHALQEPVLLERFLVLQAGLTFAAYSVYYYQDFCYGPRFFFSLLPAAALGAARAVEALARLAGPGAVRRWLSLTAAFALLLTGHQAWASLARKYWNIDSTFQRFVQSNIEGPALLFLRNPTRPRLALARLLTGRGLAREQVMAIVGQDALDVDGLTSDLALAATPGQAAEVLRRHLAEARGRDPIHFDISPWEVVRLNSADPLRQDVVIALDLGDEANERLRAALPHHVPWLAGCRFGEPFLLPYEPAGVPRF